MHTIPKRQELTSWQLTIYYYYYYLLLLLFIRSLTSESLWGLSAFCLYWSVTGSTIQIWSHLLNDLTAGAPCWSDVLIWVYVLIVGCHGKQLWQLKQTVSDRANRYLLCNRGQTKLGPTWDLRLLRNSHCLHTFDLYCGERNYRLH